MNAHERKQQRDAITATLDTLRIKVSVARSFMDSGDAEMALKYLAEIHVLSYAGPNDYQPIKPQPPPTKTL